MSVKVKDSPAGSSSNKPNYPSVESPFILDATEKPATSAEPVATKNPTTGGTMSNNAFSRQNHAFTRVGDSIDKESRLGLLTKMMNNSLSIISSELRDGKPEGYRPPAIIRFDRDQHRVGLSAILVTMSPDSESNKSVAVFVLLLENPQSPLRPKVITTNTGERIETPAYPVDVVSGQFWTKVSSAVVERYRGGNVIGAGFLAVPGDFEVSERSSFEVDSLLKLALNRCGDALSIQNNEPPLNISQANAEDILTSRIDFSNKQRHDIFGNPIRADIVVSLNRYPKNRSKDADQFYDGDTEINSVAGYVNLEYTPPVQTQFGTVQSTEIFTPTIVITDVRQAAWASANTPELWWLAMSNAYRVTAGTSWAATFLPDLSKKHDPKDIGAITYLDSVGKKTDTRSDTFTAQMFAEFMQRYVKSNPAFIIDVNMVGENSNIDAALLACTSADSVTKDKAFKSVVKSLDNLTGGKFSEINNSRGDNEKVTWIVQPYGTDIHQGYYLNEREEKRDLRDLGTLEVLNFCKGNVQEFIAWYKTMCDVNIPHDIRLKQREGYERQYLGHNLTIVGRMQRLIINPKLISVLNEALISAGLAVSLDNVSTVYGAQKFAGNPTISSQTTASPLSINAAVNTGTADIYGSYNTDIYSGFIR